MKIVIAGGGIAGAYLAKGIKKSDSKDEHEVLILSDEAYMPYDRIHLCRLVDGSYSLKNITLELEPSIKVKLNHKVTGLDRENKRVITHRGEYTYDKLIIATGSRPRSLFDISQIENAAVFRSVKDAQKIRKGIQNREVVIVGAGPIALELLDTLNHMDNILKITLLVRSHALYDKTLSLQTIKMIESFYLESKKIRISYEDEIIDKIVTNHKIEVIKTKKLEIKDPFLIFGIGIEPNIDFARESLRCNRGILTDLHMQSSDKDIYAVGEAAEIEALGFVAGHVKECTLEADVAIANILNREEKVFQPEVTVDMLKVGDFGLIDVKSPRFLPKESYEKILIVSEKARRVDEYYVQNDKLMRFVGISTNIDIGYIENLIKEDKTIDATYLFQNRKISKRGPLICSCTHMYQKDLEEIIVGHGVTNFQELGEYTEAGRVCGRCRKQVEGIIAASQNLIDYKKVHKRHEDVEREKALMLAKKRVEKFEKLHPKNSIDSENLSSAMDAYEITRHELNRWISMVTAHMQLHPEFENVVKEGINALNKVPIVWLELADCSGNSEAFIKSAHPDIADLIFEYISLDYHELLMSASGEQSETQLEEMMREEKNRYLLIVEGAIPLAMDGKYLRIGQKGETGISLLQRCAQNAALVIAVGSCAFDGGVVAAAPNPTGAVGVAEALQREDIINLPGCPVNPVNIVGTLLSYLMFEELPALDKYHRPLWAYEGRIHDNCERRGHYELGEFVREWGDEGAKKGWCLFEMGCKGPYAHANCPTMKFNQGTSWPVAAGHGCMGCVEKGFFDRLANERKLKEEP